MKKQFLKELKPGDRVQNFFVAKSKQLEYFRDASKGQFLTVVLADRSGQMVAKAWDTGPAFYDSFAEEDVIAVLGRVELYLGQPQIIVQKLRPARPEDKDVFYNDDDLVPSTSKDVAALWQTVTAAAAEIGNPHLKTLVQGILAEEDLAAGLLAAPATKKMHHSYRGGLLEHIVEMLTLSQCLMSLNPSIDRDLLTAGIIIHDLGSVEAARYEHDIDYSDAGRLVGSVVLGDRMVAERIAAIPDFPPDLALVVSHLILSQHGEVDRGAVRLPQTMEAVALSLLKRLSGDVNHVQQVLDLQFDPSKPWTEYDRMSERYFYRGPGESEADQADQEQDLRPERPEAESGSPNYTIEEQAASGLPVIGDRPAKPNGHK